MIQILRETKDYIVVNKPSGLITESNQYENSLESELKMYLTGSGIKKPFVGVVHRLDRVTSGCVLFAKKKSALVYFNRLLEDKKLNKTYQAVVPRANKALPRIVVNHLEKDQKNKIARISDKSNPKAKYAKLEIKTLVSSDLSLLEIKLFTGRFHQIRVQLSELGLPIYGDAKYSSEFKLEENKICLHASKLTFPEFNGTEIIEVYADKPEFYPWSIFQ